MNLVDIMYNEIMDHLMLIILVINGNQNGTWHKKGC